jgi:hypothetical protein
MIVQVSTLSGEAVVPLNAACYADRLIDARGSATRADAMSFKQRERRRTQPRRWPRGRFRPRISPLLIDVAGESAATTQYPPGRETWSVR